MIITIEVEVEVPDDITDERKSEVKAYVIDEISYWDYDVVFED